MVMLLRAVLGGCLGAVACCWSGVGGVWAVDMGGGVCVSD